MRALPLTPPSRGAPPSSRLPRGLAPLGIHDFLLFWIGFATSNAGRWVELTGALWLVYELAQSPVLLGLLGAARAVPTIILSPLAGVIADRVDQRHLLIATQGLALIVSLAVGTLVVVGDVELWHIYLAVAIQAAITAFDAAGRQALFPRLIPRSSLPEAVTLSITAARLAKLVGPVIGGFAIAALGIASPFFLNALSFVVLMVALVMIRALAALPPRQRHSFFADLREGMLHIIRTPVVSGLFKLEIAFALFEMNPVMIAIVGREILGVGPEAMGLLLAAPATGSFIGIAWLIFAGHAQRQGRFNVLCTLAYAFALVLFAATQVFAAALMALALIGILDALVTVTRSSVTQLVAPGRMRGRIMANMGMVTRGISPLAETQSGILAAALGPPVAIVAAAGALAVASVTTAWLNRPLWSFSRADDLRASSEQDR